MRLRWCDRADSDSSIEINEHPAITDDDSVPRERFDRRSLQRSSLVIEEAAVAVTLKPLFVPGYATP